MPADSGPANGHDDLSFADRPNDDFIASTEAGSTHRFHREGYLILG